MKKLSNGNVDSYDSIAKQAKEFLNRSQEVKNNDLDKSQSGLKNPCVFGKHNPKFNNQISL